MPRKKKAEIAVYNDVWCQFCGNIAIFPWSQFWWKNEKLFINKVKIIVCEPCYNKMKFEKRVVKSFSDWNI